MHTFPRQPGSPRPTQESCRAGPGHTGTAPGKLGTGALHALRGGRWGAAGKPTTPATAAEGSPLTAGPDSRAKVGGAGSGGDGGAGYRPARGPARGGGGILKRPKVGSRQPSLPSHLHGTKGLLRAGFAQLRPDPEEKKLFPGCGSRARGGGGLAGRGATCGRSRPPGEARRRRSPPRWPPPCSGTAPCAW